MGYYNKQHKVLEGLIGQDPTYNRSQFAEQQLGMAKSMFGGRMFGAPQLERNLFSSQANFMGNVNRNATDSSQALALGAAGLGQTNEALSDLQIKEAQNKYAMLNNLNQAYGVSIGEDQNVEADKVRKYEDLVKIRGAQAANALGKRKALWNTVGQIANLGVSAFTGGMSGGMFGGGGAGGGAGRGGSPWGIPQPG